MIVIAKDKLKKAQLLYPAATETLLGWYQVIKQSNFLSESDLRASFGELYSFERQFEFKVPGTTLLIYTLINFETQVAYIEKIQPGRI
jgi:mRNA-degrading endonuclease HigB of HigAB toxin-antitoxin module